jgi:protein-tyrosine phosphatase
MLDRLLFVCKANLIRSPLAENLFRELAAESGLADRFEVDSAGVATGWEGSPPHPAMQRVAQAHGLNLRGHSRRITATDFDRFDLILAMDRENQQELEALARDERDRAKVRLLREFDPQGGAAIDVPDPYFDDIDGFEHTYQIVERSIRGLLQTLSSEEP